MAWHGHLRLDYARDRDGRTTALDRHEGPLRVLQRLYPEGPAICHHVLVHPPGGIVGGDTLTLEANLAAGCHALITTPSATRFYRSAGEPAMQTVVAALADGARFEWLPQETLVYDAALAGNRMRFELAADAEMIGWDLVALGLPAAGQPFARGHYRQDLTLWSGGHCRWIERGMVRGDDAELLDGPTGLAGARVFATLWFAVGAAMATGRREALVEAARAVAGDESRCGITAPDDGIVVMRLLADEVESATALLRRVRAAWRHEAWGLPAESPRIWRT